MIYPVKIETLSAPLGQFAGADPGEVCQLIFEKGGSVTALRSLLGPATEILREFALTGSPEVFGIGSLLRDLALADDLMESTKSFQKKTLATALSDAEQNAACRSIRHADRIGNIVRTQAFPPFSEEITTVIANAHSNLLANALDIKQALLAQPKAGDDDFIADPDIFISLPEAKVSLPTLVAGVGAAMLLGAGLFYFAIRVQEE